MFFSDILSTRQIITDKADQDPYLREWRDRFHGACAAVLLPESTDQVAQIMRTAYHHNIQIVPQGGNTGLVGGQIPDKSGKQYVLSLKRMNKLRDMSPHDFALTAEAGVVLEDLHTALEETSLMFPLRLASEGSAQIGGLISSNAGGTSVLQYGNMRDLILGLEVVLPNGDILHDLHYLRKANKGLSFNGLFAGTEGRLGIITAASLKLFPKPKSKIYMLVGTENVEKVIALLFLLREHLGASLTECELIPHMGFKFIFKHYPQIQNPFQTTPEWGCLIEVSSAFSQSLIMPVFEEVFAEAYKKNIMTDAVIAQSETQAKNLRDIRMLMSECQKFEGASIKHDVSVPIKSVPELIKRGIAAAQKIIPDIRPLPFGHIGDGNIHFNFTQPAHMEKSAFMTYEPELNATIFDIVHDLKGSFSAEHGIGVLRQQQLKDYSSAVENSLRQRIKDAIDEKHVLG
ncbi:MAG: FAD-binding oxidoreductase [Pseudomonadota bacterium]